MKTYIVINLTDTDKVLWSQVDQTSAQTARRNVANTQCILSYYHLPSFVGEEGLKPVLTLDHTLALELLATPEWTPEDPE